MALGAGPSSLSPPSITSSLPSTAADSLPTPSTNDESPLEPTASVTPLILTATGLEPNSNDDTTRPLLVFDGLIQRRTAKVCLDSGASANFISASFAKSCSLSPVALSGSLSLPVTLADGSSISTSTLYRVPVRLGDYSTIVHAYGLELSDSFQLVLGMPWLERASPGIDFPHRTMTLMHRGRKLTFRPSTDNKGHKNCDGLTISALQLKRAVRKGADLYAVVVSEANEEQPSAPPTSIQSILTEYSDIFQELPDGLPPVRGVEHEIPLKPGAVPVVRPVYRMSEAELKELKSQLDEIGRAHV